MLCPIFSGGLLSSGSGGYVKIRVTLESAFALSEFQLQPPNMVLDICKEEQRQLQSQESLEDASSFALKLIQDSKNNSVIRKCEKQLVGPIRQKSEKSLMLMTNNSANRVRGTDADNGNWQVDCDINSSFLRCCMVYQDVQKIPRNHLRSARSNSSETNPISTNVFFPQVFAMESIFGAQISSLERITTRSGSP